MNKKITAEIHTSYIPDEDKTIVWQSLYVDGELIQQAVIGWYCGEPDDKNTLQYSEMPTIGQYIM